MATLFVLGVVSMAPIRPRATLASPVKVAPGIGEGGPLVMLVCPCDEVTHGDAKAIPLGLQMPVGHPNWCSHVQTDTAQNSTQYPSPKQGNGHFGLVNP